MKKIGLWLVLYVLLQVIGWFILERLNLLYSSVPEVISIIVAILAPIVILQWRELRGN
jgi:hypothetical protein